ncbi:hypothetical protein UT300007_35080 [Clostridium sp. CTA-7]
MGSEKRRLEGIMLFGIIGLLFGLVGNISYYLKLTGIYIEFFYNIDIESASIMMIIPTIGLGIAAIVNYKLNVDEEILEELKNKTLFFKLICILFAFYMIFTIVVMKNLVLFRTAILMEILLILMYIIERKAKALELTDRQLKWKRDYDYPGTYNKESNFFWRMKFKFSPHVKVKWKDRVNRIKWMKLLFMIFFMLRDFDREVYIILIIFIPDLIYFFEVIFGLYTKTSGICTGVVEVGESENSSVIIYKAYITDYENEEEITFKVRDYCYISERDEVVVVHSMITKRVIEVQGIRMDFI